MIIEIQLYLIIIIKESFQLYYYTSTDYYSYYAATLSYGDDEQWNVTIS